MLIDVLLTNIDGKIIKWTGRPPNSLLSIQFCFYYYYLCVSQVLVACSKFCNLEIILNSLTQTQACD